MNRLVKTYAARIGLDRDRYGAHSLRAGLATSEAGVSERAIMNQTGHDRCRSCGATSEAGPCSRRTPPPRWGCRTDDRERLAMTSRSRSSHPTSGRTRPLSWRRVVVGTACLESQDGIDVVIEADAALHC